MLERGAAERAISEAGDETAHRAVERFEKLLASWSHKPAWRITRQGYTWKVTTNDPVFNYQDEGTEGPYMIRPRRKRALFWQGARHPVRAVRHPGLKPQDFTGQVERASRNDFKELLEEEIRAIQGTAR